MAEQVLDVSQAISLYLDLEPGKTVDLEVAAAMAIQWSRAIKAAGIALDPDYDYRVSLIAAKPGSSNWLAKVERSKANQTLVQIKSGWEQLPLILRVTIGLGVVIPMTAVPTWKFWAGDDGFSETQVEQIEDALKKVIGDKDVTAHKQAMYKDAQRDRTIVGIGGGVPDTPDWKPKQTVPANQFALVEGLFEPVEETKERTILIGPHGRVQFDC